MCEKISGDYKISVSFVRNDKQDSRIVASSHPRELSMGYKSTGVFAIT